MIYFNIVFFHQIEICFFLNLSRLLLGDGELDQFALLVLLRSNLPICLDQLSGPMAIASHVRASEDISIVVGELALALLHPILPSPRVLFVLLLPSVRPLSMSQSRLPLPH